MGMKVDMSFSQIKQQMAQRSSQLQQNKKEVNAKQIQQDKAIEQTKGKIFEIWA